MNEAAEAQAFRSLIAHLRHRTDVQNVDLMGVGGFCRNCLGDWLAEAAGVSKESGREHVYGMPYAAYKVAHQAPATPEQLDLMAASVAKNA